MSGAAGRVLRELRGDILRGALAQGTRLTESSLCGRYDVSRVPVREALRTLAAEGFVDVRPGSGATVATISTDDAADLYAVRCTIEEITARRCAARVAAGGADGLVARLDEIVTAGLAAVRAGEPADLPALNTRFHLTMARESGSASLLSLFRQVADRIQWIYAANVDVQGERSWTEHRGILAAISAGDETVAAERAGEHIANSRRAFLETRPT
ncbi:GntR family transcriptional regulator [Pseudonocardia kunmingensis]|uniref:GntR family transcriptional regulator n=1 Tax=Pseudonocardia kunmingensis TaxID=630975 RepID=A0A543DIK1_9PSEU|nr:GntR family transcriptional regulator [Pseudonocardia kunmingensis]TQM09167.1 GntR family transcriptional regulator [Pseudonocardia kunmingensis]